MTTLATSRVNRTRLPLAEMSIFSAMLAPLNTIVSAPAWPSIVSLPSPGFQTNVSSPARRPGHVVARPPMTRSFPSPPMIESAPSPPLTASRIPRSRSEALLIVSAPSLAVERQPVVGRLGGEDR